MRNRLLNFQFNYFALKFKLPKAFILVLFFLFLCSHPVNGKRKSFILVQIKRILSLNRLNALKKYIHFRN